MISLSLDSHELQYNYLHHPVSEERIDGSPFLQFKEMWAVCSSNLTLWVVYSSNFTLWIVYSLSSARISLGLSCFFVEFHDV